MSAPIKLKPYLITLGPFLTSIYLERDNDSIVLCVKAWKKLGSSWQTLTPYSRTFPPDRIVDIIDVKAIANVYGFREVFIALSRQKRFFLQTVKFGDNGVVTVEGARSINRQVPPHSWLLDGPMLIGVDLDLNLEVFAVGSNFTAETAILCDGKSKGKVLAVEKLLDSMLYLACQNEMGTVVSDVFKLDYGLIERTNSSSAAKAIPEIFHGVIEALLTVEIYLDEDKLRTNLFVCTTHKSISRVIDGRILNTINMITGSQLDINFSWFFLCEKGQNRLVLHDSETNNVTLICGNSFTLLDHSFKNLESHEMIAKSNYPGPEELLVVTPDGTKPPQMLNVFALNEQTPKISKGALKAVTGFKNAVQSGVVALERRERKLQDKENLIASLIDGLKGCKIVNCRFGETVPLFEEMDSNESVQPKAPQVSLTEVFRASVSGNVMLVLECESLDLTFTSESKPLFFVTSQDLPEMRCKVVSTHFVKAKCVVAIVIKHPIITVSKWGLSVMLKQGRTFYCISTIEINFTSLEPLHLDTFPFKNKKAVLWALKKTKLYSDVVLLSPRQVLQSNSSLFCDKMKFEHHSASGLFLAKASSSLPGVLIDPRSNESSDRESHFSIHCDNLPQCSIFIQSLLEAAPKHCLVMTERRFQGLDKAKDCQRLVKLLKDLSFSLKEEMRSLTMRPMKRKIICQDNNELALFLKTKEEDDVQISHHELNTRYSSVIDRYFPLIYSVIVDLKS